MGRVVGSGSERRLAPVGGAKPVPTSRSAMLCPARVRPVLRPSPDCLHGGTRSRRRDMARPASSCRFAIRRAPDASNGPPGGGPFEGGYRNASAVALATSTLTATMAPTLTAAHYMRSMRSPPSRVSLVSHMGTSSRERADGPEHDDHRDDNPGDGDGHLHDVEQPSHWDLRQPAFRDLRLGPELAKRMAGARRFADNTMRAGTKAAGSPGR